ncbi:piggyBac transposable element-derived protein 4-like [Harmonia axyridis]|uniref:piggyBac transposable element-derived protein 4-like n=1 Tax=Harmonia axyridis TaxID=115357 RepID=UPI001E279624|nr:piggyBac transposable element-derived protein 4-like [Harmonia axyridis]
MSSRARKIVSLAVKSLNEEDSQQATSSADPDPSSQESPCTRNSPLLPQAAGSNQRSRAYIISSSESEPFESSEDSYRPSDDEVETPNVLSESEVSSDDDKNDNGNVAETDDLDRWGPCTELPVTFQFTRQSGLKKDSLDLNKPFDIYQQFITNEIIDLIVSETNRYASQLKSKPLRPRSLLHKWVDTNREEMQRFLAVLLIMGINELPKMRLYWSNDEMYGNDLIKKTMTRNRFDMMLRCLHFTDNTDPEANADRLSKIKTVVELICRQFQETLTPNEEVVIDESMVPWRGRLVFRQYLPAKSHKYGVKIYKVCTTEGYTYDLRIYAGKNISTGVTAQNGKGHTYNICMDLLKDLKHEGRILYIDNFYTSVQLCRDLLQSHTYVCGTLRSNRKGNPKTVCTKKLKRGEVYGQQNQDGIRVLKWVDKRPVLMISSVPAHAACLVPTGRKNRNGDDIVKPHAIIAYNKAKKGVDVSDQMSSYYTCLRKSLKWYKKVIFEIMLGTCIVNAWVLHNNYNKGGKKMDMLRFRENVIHGLLNQGDATTSADIQGGGDGPMNENLEHSRKRKRSKSQHKIGKYEGSARKNRRRCSACYKRIQQEMGSKEARVKAKKVLTYCVDCDEKPTLCISCFNELHK